MALKLRGLVRPEVKNRKIKLPRKRKNGPIIAGVDLVAASSFASPSELLQKIAQFAPHLIALLEGPQVDPRTVPLCDRTTDDLIRLLEFGWLPSEVATMWGVDRSRLLLWINYDLQRGARVRLARKGQAEIWDRIGFAIGLFAPSDRVEMARAKLLMDHCKWRSSMYNPDDYVKRLAIKKLTEDKDARELTSAELHVIAQGDVIPGGF